MYERYVRRDSQNIYDLTNKDLSSIKVVRLQTSVLSSCLLLNPQELEHLELAGKIPALHIFNIMQCITARSQSFDKTSRG
jgi:hypothetical protein